MRRKGKALVSVLLSVTMVAAMMLTACGNKEGDGKIEINLVQYKPEAVDAFEAIEQKFNETHDDIHLTIDGNVCLGIGVGSLQVVFCNDNGGVEGSKTLEHTLWGNLLQVIA